MKTMEGISGNGASAAAGVILENAAADFEEQRRNCIATAAYYKAQVRGFVPGRELDDWLQAEAEFEEQGQPH
jgi:DUF2934 family protein